MSIKKFASFVFAGSLLCILMMGCSSKERGYYNDYQNAKKAVDTVDKVTKD